MQCAHVVTETEREQNNARLEMHCTFSLRENRMMHSLIICNVRSHEEQNDARVEIQCAFSLRDNIIDTGKISQIIIT